MLPSPDQKDLGLFIAQCSQSRLKAARHGEWSQVMEGRASYNEIYTFKKRKREGDSDSISACTHKTQARGKSRKHNEIKQEKFF